MPQARLRRESDGANVPAMPRMAPTTSPIAEICGILESFILNSGGGWQTRYHEFHAILNVNFDQGPLHASLSRCAGRGFESDLAATGSLDT
jgi:hypothetical protein